MGKLNTKKVIPGIVRKTGLRADGRNIAYGFYNGFTVALYHGANEKFIIAIAAAKENDTLENEALGLEWKKMPQIASFNCKDSRINFFTEYLGKQAVFEQNVISILDHVTNTLNRFGFHTCDELTGSNEEPVYVCWEKSTPHFYSESTYQRRLALLREQEEKDPRQENYTKGMLAGIAGILAGMAFMVFCNWGGEIQSLSGAVMGFFSLYLYEKYAGKISAKGIVSLSILMVIGLLLTIRINTAMSLHEAIPSISFGYAFKNYHDLIRLGYVDKYPHYFNLALYFLMTAMGAIPQIIYFAKSEKRRFLLTKLL